MTAVQGVIVSEEDKDCKGDASGKSVSHGVLPGKTSHNKGNSSLLALFIAT